jgi:hypothetical protein
MAIYVTTDNPDKLLTNIIDKIKEKTIQTWTIDSAGDFTHASQWKEKAWFRPKTIDGKLVFGIIGRKDEKMKKLLYGVYHGRFAEMLLSHFDNDIEIIELTSKGIKSIDSFT